jgi:hypothetical protein
MAESVKITELPAISSLVNDDIIVVVDENETQTSKATLGQVKNMDCGPNTVKESALALGAVTATKHGFSGPDKIVTRSESGAGAGAEFPLTPYARGLLAAANGPDARAYLDALQTTADPTFTGQVRIAKGTEAFPSLTFTDDEDTGMFSPQPNSIGFTMEGNEFIRFVSDGNTLSRTYVDSGLSLLLPQYSVRAWARFSGGTGTAATFQSAGTIASRYGFWGQTLWFETNTINKIIEIEAAWGNTVTAYGTNWPGDTRNNYTTPWDNVHYYWTGSGWATTPASGKSWIASLTVTPNPNITMFQTGNVTAIKGLGSGTFELTFATPMPDTNYAVLVTSTRNANWSASGDQITQRTVNTCRIQHVEGGVGAVSNDFNVIVIR